MEFALPTWHSPFFFKALCMHRNGTVQSGCTYQRDGDVIFPLLTLKWSAKPDFTHDTHCQLSNLQMSFLRNPQEKHFIFPAAVFDFTMQNYPSARCTQQCDNLKNKTKPKPGVHRMVARKVCSLFNVKLGWGGDTFKRTCKKLYSTEHGKSFKALCHQLSATTLCFNLKKCQEPSP